MTWFVLAVAAFLTSIISAILGMGGGIMLLATMFCFLPHADAIPTHAAVQLASNGTRAAAFARNVDVRSFVAFLGGVVPGTAVGMFLLWSLGQPETSEPYLKTLIGLFILTVTYMPKRRAAGDGGDSMWGFTGMGLLAGTAALTVGAVGPLIAPIFARRDFAKERLIATKAVCQLTTHALKIPAFLLLRQDLELGRLGALALVMIAMVIPGTLLGKRLLVHVSHDAFVVAYRVALTLAGLKVLVVDGLLKF